MTIEQRRRAETLLEDILQVRTLNVRAVRRRGASPARAPIAPRPSPHDSHATQPDDSDSDNEESGPAAGAADTGALPHSLVLQASQRVDRLAASPGRQVTWEEATGMRTVAPGEDDKEDKGGEEGGAAGGS